MINLRYHIISITAVFLALGIGLTLGSTFLDRVTVDTLESQLDERRAPGARDATRRTGRCASGSTTWKGVTPTSRPSCPSSCSRAGSKRCPCSSWPPRAPTSPSSPRRWTRSGTRRAQVAGTWWLTDRWVLDDDDEVDELSGLLGLTTKDVDRLRRNSAIRMADLLAGASQPAASAGQLQGPNEPPLVAQLVDAGFVDYEAISGASEARVLLPAAGARYVVVSSTGTPDGPEAFAGRAPRRAVGGGRGAGGRGAGRRGPARRRGRTGHRGRSGAPRSSDRSARVS